ncbi:MAG TPA: peptidoglycan bridge formation glycyltransferase FemA/FemB family protein, partial [Terriglobales bacterium]
YKVPAVFFVNSSCLDNRQLALENLIAYVFNQFGIAAIRTAAANNQAATETQVNSLADVFAHFLPRTSLAGRKAFRHALIEIAQIDDAQLAKQANLYLTSDQLRDLPSFNIEIGNHTFSHANCRTLSPSDFAEEIDKNKEALEAITGTHVRSFSVPYGSSADLTEKLATHLSDEGCEAIFLAEGRANQASGRKQIDRVSLQASSKPGFFSEIEILPRLRTLGNASAPAATPPPPSLASASNASRNSWHVEIDQATLAEWSVLLDHFSDANLYQTWSYGEIRWGSQNLSHIVLKRNREAVAIAQLRIVTKFNAGIAYLRWGPLCHRRGTDPDPEIAQHIARALHDEYVAKRGLLLQILPNAFAGTSRAALFESAFSKFTPQPATPTTSYRTMVVDLDPPLDQLRKNLDPKWRNKLTQAEKKDLKITAGTGLAEYRAFCQMYYEMRQRKNFDTTVDVEEFARIQQHLPANHRMITLLCEQNGSPVAGLVASALGDSAIYLLGATSHDGLNARGAYLLQWTLIQHLKASGIRWYDLGGINPDDNPGVYSFKQGLSGVDLHHLPMLTACDNLLSSALVTAGLTAKRITQALRRSTSTPSPRNENNQTTSPKTTTLEPGNATVSTMN